MIDLFVVYSFIKKLVTPFDEWSAFKSGVIDAKGNILKKERNTKEEKESFTVWDKLILNIKKTLAKLPGGSTKLATYAAALYLLKEHKDILENESLLTEEMSIIIEDGIANTVGSGAVAGLGVGPQGEPPVYKKPKPLKRKLPFYYFNEQDEVVRSDVGVFGSVPAKHLTIQKHRKKYTKKQIPLTGADDEK